MRKLYRGNNAKVTAILLALMLLLGMAGLPAYAEEDAFSVQSVQLSENSINVGKSVTLTIKTAGLPDSIDSAEAVIKMEDVDVTKNVSVKKTSNSTYTGTVSIDDTWFNGKYYVQSVDFGDGTYKDHLGRFDATLNVSGGEDYIETPLLQDINISKAKATAGDSIEITAQVASNKDYDAILVWFNSTKKSEKTGENSYTTNTNHNTMVGYLTRVSKGLYQGEIEVSKYDGNGKYFISDVVEYHEYGKGERIRAKSDYTFYDKYFEIYGCEENEGAFIESFTVKKISSNSFRLIAKLKDIEYDPLYTRAEIGYDEVNYYRICALEKQDDGTYAGEYTIDDERGPGKAYVVSVNATDTSGNMYESFEYRDCILQTDNASLLSGIPQLKNVSFSKNSVVKGTDVDITIDCYSPYGIKYSSALVYSYETGKDYLVYLNKESESDNQVKLKGTFAVDDEWDTGLYLIKRISLTSDGDPRVFQYFEDVYQPYFYVNEVSELIGDVNGTNKVDAEDLTILARHLARIDMITSSALLNNADTNKDGSVSADDLTRLAKYVAKIIPAM